ncbi:MAG: hypothetical protein WC389_19955, partial [Lutibacter sp.]
MVNSEIKQLETQLLDAVSYFLKTATATSIHHGELLERIRQVDSRAFLCGGAIRDILLSKRDGRKSIIPRDLDIILGFEHPETVAALFSDCKQKWNCYGGVEICHKHWSLDIWALQKTWAFEQGLIKGSSFRDFPNTTFLNIESVAVQLFSKRGKKREIYSKGFFESILTNTIEINLQENPNPKSCIARALYIANKFGFKIGRKLANYIMQTTHEIEIEELLQAYQARYNQREITADILNLWIKEIKRQLRAHQNLSIQLPVNDK